MERGLGEGDRGEGVREMEKGLGSEEVGRGKVGPWRGMRGLDLKERDRERERKRENKKFRC